MRYENESCVLCGEVFKSDDTVVVCPECGAPHHKSCYERLEKCACDNLHAEGYIWQKSDEKSFSSMNTDEVKEIKICPFCQSENDIETQFCKNCHAPFIEAEETKTSEYIYIDSEKIDCSEFIDAENTVTVGEASAYIKSNKERFIKSFLKAKFTKSNQKFNFAAFFFAPFWFFYRKMYAPGAAFSGLSIATLFFYMSIVNRVFPEAISYLSSLSGQTAVNQSELIKKYQEFIILGMKNHPGLYKVVAVFPLIFLIINIVAGFLANKLYLKKIKNDIAKIKSVSPNQEIFKTYLYAKGGTSIVLVVLSFFAIESLVQMLLML